MKRVEDDVYECGVSRHIATNSGTHMGGVYSRKHGTHVQETVGEALRLA